MKTIVYDPRRGANATYWDMKPQEQKWILDQLERIAIEYLERSISRDQLDRNLIEYLNAEQRDLGRSPKHNNKTNTAASVIGGILSNIRLGSTKNLTDKACTKIKVILDDIERGIAQGILPDIRVEGVEYQQMGQRESDNATPFEELFTQ